MRKAGDALYPRSGVLPSFEYEPWGDTGALCTVEGTEHCAGGHWSTVQGDRSALLVHSQALEPATAHCPLLGLIHPPPLVPLVIYHTNIRPATTHCVPVGLVPLIIQPRDDPFLLQLHETLMSGGWGGEH